MQLAVLVLPVHQVAVLVFLVHQVALCAGQAVITLQDTSLQVSEGTQFKVGIAKTGTAASIINVVLEVVATSQTNTNADQDFIGSSQATTFSAGTQDEVKELQLTVRNDATPEPDEMFVLQLKVTNGDGNLGDPSSGSVIIVANDDAFGLFSFDLVGLLPVQETGTSQTVSLSIVRDGGDADTVTLTYEVEGKSPGALPGIDISPAEDTIVFTDGQQVATLDLLIIPDDIPENNEEFEVTLTGVSGGASVDPSVPGPSIVSGTARVVILMNDAPIRFTMSEYNVDEANVLSTHKLTVLRGFNAEGDTSIGPVEDGATVMYAFHPLTAMAGVDYIGTNGTITFPPTNTKQEINVQILIDQIAEEAESFEVVLFDPVGDVVLAYPSVITIIINANDDPNGVLSLRTEEGSNFPAFSINEDTQRTFSEFVIIRQGGSFGTVQVAWELLRNSTHPDPATSDVMPTSDVVVFAEGEIEKRIQLTIIQDQVPEQAERFFFHLVPLSVSGGAKVEGVLMGELILQDSDEAYGLIQLADATKQFIVVSTTPRVLKLTIERNGGTIGDLDLEYNVIYHLPDDSTSTGKSPTLDGSMITGEFDISMPAIATLPAEESEVMIEVPIKDKTFLKVDAIFKVTLNKVELKDVPPVGAYNSPSLGDRVSVDLPVTPQAANGEVGFQATDTVYVNEPPDGASNNMVSLPVMREGSSGEAVIYWTAVLGDDVTAQDILATSGSVSMAQGEIEALIVLQIQPDDIPEAAEEITVQLTQVAPAESQRLRPGATEVKVIIRENDSPGGVFEFSPDMKLSYVVQEEGEAINGAIVRTGGALVKRSVEYYIDPNGNTEFYGGVNVLTFDVGETVKTFTIIAKGDNVAELSEKFELGMRQYNGEVAPVIGARNLINITVLANDGTYGIFSFNPSKTTFIMDESKKETKHSVKVPINRGQGRFGTVSVTWTIITAEAAAAQGLLPMPPQAANLEASNDEYERPPLRILDGSEDFDVPSDPLPLPDTDIPEEDTDTDTPGKSQEDTDTDIPGKSQEEDDKSPVMVPPAGADGQVAISVGTMEQGVPGNPEAVQFAAGDAAVQTTSQTISDVTPLTGTLKFLPGIGVRTVEIFSVEDEIPEELESFYMVLSDPTEGAELGPPYAAEIQIRKNDDAIYFKDPNVVVDEPQDEADVVLTVVRDGDTSAEVSVKYRTLDGLARGATDRDFKNVVEDILVFESGVSEKTITLIIYGDAVPEPNESFDVELYEPQGDVTVYYFPIATVTIRANDDANGLFHFATDETFPVPEGVKVEFNIQRDGGRYGEVNVLWEIIDPTTKQRVPDGQDFESATGIVKFDDLQQMAAAVIMPLADSIPEYEEKFILKIYDVTGGGPGDQKAIIGGYPIEVDLIVASNDDPSGVFVFSTDSRETIVPEEIDRDDMMDAVNADLVVDRLQGDFQTVAVAWEVFSYQVAGAGNLPELRDLLFLGSTSVAVPEADSKRRPDTGTMVLHFLGCEECYIEVGSEYHFDPSMITDEDGFSISAWLRIYQTPHAEGFIVAKTSPGGEKVYYGLKVSTNSKSATLELRYSTASTTSASETAARAVPPMGDDQWHLVLITVQANQVEFFVDAVSWGFSTLTGQYMDGVGVMMVGALPPGNDRFTGYMMDVRIFDRKLEEGEIRELYETPSRKDVTPISGYLTFLQGETQMHIKVSSIDDSEEEARELFEVKLISAKGGARISETGSTAILTVLKSDNANGLFGFTGECTMDKPNSEETKVYCPVERQRGDADTVTVMWAVYQGAALATEDFINATGELVFSPGERTKTLSASVYDDALPELSENFDIILQSAISSDGEVGTTLTSGASILGSASLNTITVAASDDPYGLLQFVASPPLPGETNFPPAEESPQMTVPEESGLVTLTVVRAQGVIGTVSVEWRTRDGTAKSSGKATPDYQAGVNRITFAPNQQVATLNVLVYDNTIPESEKYFYVDLLNPGGGASVGLGSTITVNIAHSDQAYGVFQYSDDSRLTTTEELYDSEYNVINLKVVRQGGTIGAVNVTWIVISDLDDDIVQDSGSVTFDPGQTEGYVPLMIRGDSKPEMDEAFAVQLTSVTGGGSLGDSGKLTALVTIEANDDPYGTFIISQSDRPVRVTESNTVVAITIERKAGSGIFGTVQVMYRTLAPLEVYNFLPGITARADEADFESTTGLFQFFPNELSKQFNMTISEDAVPELDESVFVILTDVQLVTGTQVVDSPRLGTDPELYGQIIIEANDFTHGTLELSASAVSVPEDFQEPLAYLIRNDGAFGQVSIKFEVVAGSATYGLDYSVSSTDVILANGQRKVEIPVEIINDMLPEIEETFTIRLTSQITGGATLGNVKETEVTIEKSDDPNGAFRFEESGPGVFQTSVEEPGVGETSVVNIPVFRSGGSLGVVSVNWQASLNGGGNVDTDIVPTSGSALFVSNEIRQYITLTILPDPHPEGTEDIIITLTDASNGGAISTTMSTFTVSILPNDNPHGTLEYTSATYTLQELPGNEEQFITVARIGGYFGDLMLYYSTEEIDIMTEITRSGGTVFDYYDAPLEGQLDVSEVGTRWDVSQQTDPLLACAIACFLTEACLSFNFDENLPDCHWYTMADASSLRDLTGYKYYQKNTQKANALYERKALAGADYLQVTEASVIIKDGATEGQLPISILPDDIPELDEMFLIKLTRVELVGGPPLNPENVPELGLLREASVIIGRNDDANGVFSISSNDPRAGSDGKLIEVEERDNFAVELVVERKGGTIGMVQVSWFINAAVSTATMSQDYLADGATLTFADGDTRRILTIGIEDDSIPENDETIVVQLRNSQGGATISTNNKVDITIMANDYVAGMLEFAQTAYLAEEGSTLLLIIRRSEPALGTVRVDWVIEDVESIPAQNKFAMYQGSFTFLPGEIEKELTLQVLRDDQPKINQEYLISLVNVITDGVRDTGGAAVDPQKGTAILTIQGGNDPHGIFSFAQGDLKREVKEDEIAIQLTVVRKFGAIGVVRIFYDVRAGSVSALSDNLHLALSGADFVSVKQSYLDIGDGENTGMIQVTIYDDNIAEVNEAFLVDITQVQLIDPVTSSFQPVLSPTARMAEIIIEANDGTHGEIVFQVTSAVVNVEEENRNITLDVVRKKGTFGLVSVFCFAQSDAGGATRGIDFNFEPTELVFVAGQTLNTITVQLLDDSEPEPSESFEILLASPKDGVTLGFPHRAEVTIAASDQAGGVVSFESGEMITLNEPSLTSTLSETQADMRVLRAPGVYGVVNVPFVVTMVDSTDDVTDLAPPDGYITFKDREGLVVLSIGAVADNLPEETETFLVTLLPPDGGATLGTITQRRIVIERNDAPYGLVEIFPMGATNNSIDVEEDAGTIYLDVRRSRGALDTVTVDMVTRGVSAHAEMGRDLYLSVIQEIKAKHNYGWYSYMYKDEIFFVLLNDQRTGSLTTSVDSDGSMGDYEPDNVVHSVLYRWQGELTPVQTIETDGATNALYLTLDDESYLVITNKGSPGRYETYSRIYQIQSDGTLKVFQDLQTRGASDVEFFSHTNQRWLLITNAVNNADQTAINSNIYQWDVINRRFSRVPVQYLATRGAMATVAMEIDDTLYLAVANQYDNMGDSVKKYEINSVIYKLDRSNHFSIHQQVATQGAVDLAYFELDEDKYLVIANQRDDLGVYHQKVVVYVWNEFSAVFSPVQEIEVVDVQAVNVYVAPNGITHLAVACRGTDSAVYAWEDATGQFNKTWTGHPARQLYPQVINERGGAMVVVAEARPSDVTSPKHINVYLAAMLDLNDSDYVFRTTTLTFDPGQTYLQTSVNVLEDDLPEDTELFVVELTNPREGAEVGPHKEVSIRILSNDDGHGIIEFAQDSLEKRISELEGADYQVAVNVARLRGLNGRVAVKWRATGEHNGIYDIRPLEGQVEFADGQAVASITLTVRDDTLAELDETTLITLLSVVETGTTLAGRGATIGENKQCTLIVMANDSPHGVVSWEVPSYLTTEPEGTDSTTMLHIIRQQGRVGDVRVSYSTGRATSLPPKEQAISGKDYVAAQTTVDMLNDVDRVAVEIPILADSDPEVAETFLVKLTGVVLVGSSPLEGTGPSVRITGNSASVTIAENDNARGVIEFDVDRNIENRVDTYEGLGVLELRLRRTIGFFGEVEVSWQASPREATTDDFSPSGGSVRFAEEQIEAVIQINIIDDDIPEELQTFDVQLIRITSGGATLGADNSVRVGILRNDSPNGIFSLIDLSKPGPVEKSVQESKYENDPQGLVTFDIFRKGSEGEVHVIWRMSADAVADFEAPLTGTVTFDRGETIKSITLKTKKDDILEGEERFTLSLVSADNNGDISPTQGDATVVILPDDGASGLISILPETRFVLMGEPSADYDGTAEIKMTRGTGMFGTTRVTWQMVPRRLDAFVQTQGEVVFVDKQKDAIITVQSKDDNAPELRQSFTLEITSATGGATVDPTARSAEILVVASDYPHGLVQFAYPTTTTVPEETGQVVVTVERDFGSVGTLRVYYTTSSGSASSTVDANQDFQATSGWLTFSNTETRQTLAVDVINDNQAEGPEEFYVNLTSIQLLQPVSNNYSVVGGLMLDMAPAIGPASVKTVIIDKNDNAEGILQFADESLRFQAYEDEGIAQVPVVRGPGAYGEVKATFVATGRGATPNLDYLLLPGEVVLSNGMDRNTINITIYDDTEREAAEELQIQLTGVSGGAILGARTTSIVVIAKSDYPNGKFSFVSTEQSIANPASNKVIRLVIERTEGLIGKQTLYWRIMGYNNPNLVLEDTSDITYFTPEGREDTKGTLQWGNNEAGQKTLDLMVRPHAGWEIQKVYYIMIHDIQGFPATDGSGEANPLAGNFTLTVEKFGDPNGIVRFDGDAQQMRTFAEPTSTDGKRKLTFPIYRREGTIATIDVHWRVDGPEDAVPDMDPVEGVAQIEGDKRSGVVEFNLLADDVPELDERFTVHLTKVVGGGELDTEYTTSSFTVRYNDYPHGRFSASDDDQTIVVSSSDLQRQLRLNITRQDGTAGTVRVSYSLVYDQAQANQVQPRSGSVTFAEGDHWAIKYEDIDGGAYLSLGSTYTLTLTSAQFIGVGVTIQPELIPGGTVAKVTVPAEAANSEVGFQSKISSVDEATNIAKITISRDGVYGRVQVDWKTGLPVQDVPNAAFALGTITPDSATKVMPNGISISTFNLQLSPSQDLKPEYFALYMPSAPVTNVVGGAKLRQFDTMTQIEPNGLIQFATESLNKEIFEPENRQLEVTLYIERVYGAQDIIQVRYSTYSATAIGGVDFIQNNGAINMEEGQTRAPIFLQIMPDDIPEQDEYFLVNFTSVNKLPTDNSQDLSPRLSTLFSSAKVTIKSNSDPYGVISIVADVAEADRKASEPSVVNLIITRTGGTFGNILVEVRTVGGGEPWDYDVAVTPSEKNETIGEALGNRDIRYRAGEGQDYGRISTNIMFQEGETVKEAKVTILDDLLPEDDEVLFVYVLSRTSGVRVAQPAIDNGRMGYATITIRRNDFWNGWIGFNALNSSSVTANEDEGVPGRLTIERRNASFGDLTVYWQARLSITENTVKSEDLDLTTQLTTVQDDVVCVAGQKYCEFDINLQDDLLPENETTFVVELTQVSSGAQIDPARKFAMVTMLPSDSPNGKIQFSYSSRLVFIDKQSEVARLQIERVGYLGKQVKVKYTTLQLTGSGPEIIAGIKVYHALEGADFEPSIGELTFRPGESVHAIDVRLDAASASDNPYPKMFQVALSDVTNGAVLGEYRSNVTIADREDLLVWNLWPAASDALTDVTIDPLTKTLQSAIQEPLTSAQLTVIKQVMDNIVTTAENTQLQQGTRSSVMSVFCTLLDPSRKDSTVGSVALADLLERFAYSFLQQYDCDTCCSPSAMMTSPECPHVKFSVAKWYPEDINGYRYKRNKDYFTMPSNLLRVQDNGRNSPSPKCQPVAFVEYGNDQWFKRGDITLLNNKVFTAGVRNMAPRILTQPAMFKVYTPNNQRITRAQCVYYDTDLSQWTSGDGVCHVVNNLALVVDDFVECACKHMSNYAVISRVSDPNLIGYPVWFYISCFICMIGIALAIIAHHTCIVQAMFASNLLMHMCFAVFATELVYVIDAYLSPNHLLSQSAGDNNYRCIVMSLFVHYFFLTQFTWMVTQAVNFWKVLVLNDEHTERKYVSYFLLGWGLPVLMVALFYIVTYCVYRYATDLPADFIYGDTNNNQDICFVTNSYAGLAGVIIPSLICLMVVGVIFIQAFQVAPQWQAYDDMYRGRYNIHEVRTLLLFWALIVFTWLWGGLHMAYGQLWMLILFCIFNVAVGLFALIVYAALRNPCLPCFRPQKATYAINYGSSVAGDSAPYPIHPSLGIPSIKGSRASLVHEVWEKESMPQVGGNLRVKRSPAVNGSSVFAVPTDQYGTKPMSRDDHDSQDFDELIYALKTGGYSPSEASHQVDTGDTADSSNSQYEMRRINIADTHL